MSAFDNDVREGRIGTGDTRNDAERAQENCYATEESANILHRYTLLTYTDESHDPDTAMRRTPRVSIALLRNTSEHFCNRITFEDPTLCDHLIDDCAVRRIAMVRRTTLAVVVEPI